MSMMNPTSKKKKQNINHELRFGGCAVLVMSPLIFFAFIMSIAGMFSFILSVIGETSPYTSATDLRLRAILGIIAIIYIVIGIKFRARLQELWKARTYLKTEQERVANLIDTSSAEHRLKEHHLSDENKQGDMEFTPQSKANLRNP